MHQSVMPSVRFAGVLVLMHMSGAVVVCLTAMSVGVKLVMLLLITVDLIYYLARDVLLLLPNSWKEISLNQDGASITARDGSGFFGTVISDTLVSPYFVVLCVRLEGHRLPTARVIFPDAFSTGAFRELCVRLKFA